MNDVLDFLKNNRVQYLATVGRDGHAKCRPFMFLMEHDGKLWFGTNNRKEVFADMQENPWIEICAATPEFAWIRIAGKAAFENNMDVKNACMNIPMLKQQYQTADNPIFEVFYIDEGSAVIADMSGEAPKSYAL